MIRAHRLKFVLALAFSLISLGLFSTQKAGAVSYVVPDPSNFSSSSTYDPNVWLEVSNGGLNAPESDVRFYMNTVDSIVITNGKDNCGSPPDYGTLPTTYLLKYYGTDGTMHNLKSWSSSSLNCTTFTYTPPASSSYGKYKVSSDRSFYLFQLEVTTSSTDGVNAFKAQLGSSTNGYATYFNGNAGDKFAMQDRRNDSACDPSGRCPDSDYSLYFAPSCSATQAGIDNTAAYRTIRWFDDDAGSLEPTAGILVTVSEAPFGSSTYTEITRFYANKGSNVSGSYTIPSKLVNPAYTYKVTWNNVDRNNGIQFALPFDSIYTKVDCRPAYISGWKVPSDGSGSQQVVVNGTADAAHPYADDTIGAYDSSGNYIKAVNSNPYYFKDCTAGCTVVGQTEVFDTAIDAQNDVTFRSTDRGTVDTGWSKLGYTICDDTVNGAAACTSFIDNPANLRTTPVDLQHGHSYRIRWFYKFTPPPPTVTATASCQNDLTVTVTNNGGGTTNVYVKWDADSNGGTAGGPVLINTITSTGTSNFTKTLDTIAPGNPDRFYDGATQMFHVYATNTGGTSASTNTSMSVACGSFTLAPVSTASLKPDDESPTSFEGVTTITPTYSGWAGPAGGVSATASNRMTKNGSAIAGGVAVAQTKFMPYNSGTQTTAVSSPVLGDTYCLTITIGPSKGVVDANGNIIKIITASDQSTDCAVIGDKPYFKVLGGDVSSGGAFASINPSCNNLGVLGSYYNNNPASPGTNNGSSAQFGVFALSLVEGFASGEGTASGSPESAGLTFANGTGTTTNQSTTTPRLGGNFTTAHCLYDITNTSTTTVLGGSTNVGALNIVGSRSYSVTGDLTLGAGSLSNGTTIGISVSGDVYITGDVVYATPGSWTSKSDIPSFVIKANNIYIDPGVRQLDGIYEAKGKIYTCATGLRAPVLATNLISCNNQLLVHGSFIATSVNLMRTYGTLRNEVSPHSVPPVCSNPGAVIFSLTCAAEVFEFSPELYLSSHQIGSPGANKRFDAISSPPPIL